MRGLRYFALAVALANTLLTSEALACGGCFHRPPPPQTPPTAIQTVTDHRMVLSINATQSTLWDQIVYSGRAEDFSWILPIRNGPEVRVALANGDFLTQIDNLTAPQVRPPPPTPTRLCPTCYVPPPPPQLSFGCGANAAFAPMRTGFADSGGAALDAAFADSGVTVFREETVGPYQVVTLSGSDGMALRNWLTSNGFSVPAAIEPVLQHYISQRMDFVALRLRDPVGMGRMQPVRVTVPGAQPLLPLRMISAGIADKVGIVLMVIASSRMEAMNFPNTELDDLALRWDFSVPGLSAVSVFRQAELAASNALGSRAWLTETSQSYDMSTLRALRLPPATYDAGFTDTNSTPEDASSADASPEDATVEDVAPMEPARADYDVATTGLGAEVVITRMHADLAGRFLDRDLQLSTSTRGNRSPVYSFGTMLNTPTPAACPQLRCESGLLVGQDGINGPFGERLAPDTVFPAIYRRGDLPPYAGLSDPGTPRTPDGRRVPPGSCTTQMRNPSRRDPLFLLAGAALVHVVRRTRRRQRSNTTE